MAQAASIPPINTPGDYLGEKLPVQDFIRPGFAANFNRVPTLRGGALQFSAPLKLTDPGFQWRAAYMYATPAKGYPASPPPGAVDPAFSWFSNELEVYPNGDAIAVAGISPFSVSTAYTPLGMDITAMVTPPAYLALLPPGFSTAYISGALNTYPFSQEYGYFEMTAKVPAGVGLWPAFWLLPEDASWPPEIDAMEVLGNDPTILYTTVHTNAAPTPPSKTQYSYATKTADLSQAYHAYGVDWGPNAVRFYLDRKLVFSYPTPADCHKPFYILANLAVGGPTSWPGSPNASTVFPAHMSVRSISAWQRASYLAALPHPASMR